MFAPPSTFRTSSSPAIAVAFGLVAVAVHGSIEGRTPAQQVTQRVTATATFASRTSLQVSSRVLRFEVSDASAPAVATVEFAAGARTRNDGDVALLLRTPFELSGMSLTVEGGTTGAVSGAIAAGDSTVVARWVGGGRRIGYLRFHLRAAPGVYAIPVSFQLDAP